MYRKDTRDEVIHAHHVDPSRLGIFDSGNLNGTNSLVTQNSYKYGTIAPLKSELEDLINLIATDLEITSWKFHIEDVAPVDYTKDLALAEFLFARGAMTIRDLVENFGSKFGLTIDDNEPYVDLRFVNNIPLDDMMNNVENNPYLEVDTILASIEDKVRGDDIERPLQENDTRITDSIEEVGK